MGMYFGRKLSDMHTIQWKPYNKKIFSYEPPLRVLFAKYRGYYHAIANSKGLMEAFGWAAEAI